MANLVFLSLHSWLGYGSFLVFGAIALAGGVYCALVVPETKGRTLAEVQALLAGDKGPARMPLQQVAFPSHVGYVPTLSLPCL